MSTNLFVYGMLRFPEVTERLLGRALEGTAATLAGYRVHDLKDRDYPGILAEACAEVQGLLYLDVPAEALAILDDWEDDEYRRTPVIVRSAGAEVRAETYVWLRPDLVVD